MYITISQDITAACLRPLAFFWLPKKPSWTSFFRSEIAQGGERKLLGLLILTQTDVGYRIDVLKENRLERDGWIASLAKEASHNGLRPFLKKKDGQSTPMEARPD